MKTLEEFCLEYAAILQHVENSKRVSLMTDLLVDQGWEQTTLTAGQGWLVRQEIMANLPVGVVRVFYLLSPMDAGWLVNNQYRTQLEMPTHTHDFSCGAYSDVGADTEGTVSKA